MLEDVSLNDRYNLNKDKVLLSGTQALVRATLMQAARDKENNICSAGFVTGYRGSPLGAVDMQFEKAITETRKWNVIFQAGLNEDSAATALWGTQQAELRGEGKYQGVFGLWYGKGPGVDRSGDVFRHANLAGTSPTGGVLVALGDDHTGESSTTLHQSEFALVDAMMPILSPSGVQEILDFSNLGWAMSRYAGVWVGLKCIKDTVEVTEVVDTTLNRIDSGSLNLPGDYDVSIRLSDLPIHQEERLHLHKLPAVRRFAEIKNIDRVDFKNFKSRIGIISAGKSWLDTKHALSLLEVSEDEALRLGITTYKLGLVWPIEPSSLLSWATGLEKIIVVEEKRPLIESQVKEILFNVSQRPTVTGKMDENGHQQLNSHYALDPVTIALVLGDNIYRETKSEHIKKRLHFLKSMRESETNSSLQARTPYFCAGCPHNTSTKIPDGARAYAGIGCHYMAQWMDRNTEGFTHMGGEGANWIGEGQFSKTKHVFQNIGDGTYNHSGLMSIRAAVASGVNITYKLLFNDAVAMTGGQGHDGQLDAITLIKELKAIGVKKVIAVYDDKENLDLSKFKALVDVFPRDNLITVQKNLSKVSGVSALVYIQTCAAEKRRRRKTGALPMIDKKIFINPEVCEGCGDCGVKSNCVAILPKDTPLGTKRQIDQSSCNKDFSCLEGFCPSFVSVEGTTIKKRTAKVLKLPSVPAPILPKINQTFNIVITGVGGTGVVTVGALLGMAARLEGKGVGVMEMAGLAQKGGAVHIHCRIAEKPEHITAVRLSYGEADALIGGELLVSAGNKTLSLLDRDRTKAVCASNEANSGEFALDRNFSLPKDDMRLALCAKIGEENLRFIDAMDLTKSLLGDTIYTNVFLLGSAWQMGLVPLSMESILEAIRLNGRDVEGNLKAFDLGRSALMDTQKPSTFLQSNEISSADFNEAESLVYDRKSRLTGYQNVQLANKYEKLVNKALNVDQDFGLAVAKGYYKLLAYKDEYEVARLHVENLTSALSKEFNKGYKINFYFAPPILNLKNKDGEIRKIRFGAWAFHLLRLLAFCKFLRGTIFDVFGYSKERAEDRNLIKEYESDIERFISNLDKNTCKLMIDRALIPLDIRGFGHVKTMSIASALEKRKKIFRAIKNHSSFLRAAE